MSAFYRYTEFRPPYRKPAGDVLADRGLVHFSAKRLVLMRKTKAENMDLSPYRPMGMPPMAGSLFSNPEELR